MGLGNHSEVFGWQGLAGVVGGKGVGHDVFYKFRRLVWRLPEKYGCYVSCSNSAYMIWQVCSKAAFSSVLNAGWERVSRLASFRLMRRLAYTKGIQAGNAAPGCFSR